MHLSQSCVQPLQCCDSSLSSFANPQTYARTPYHPQFMQQQSSSTDEGCEMEHEDSDEQTQSSLPFSLQRLNSLTSSSSSSGVITNNYQTKCLSQNLSCESSQSNLLTFENLNLNNINTENNVDMPPTSSNPINSTTTTIIDNNFTTSDNGDIKCL